MANSILLQEGHPVDENLRPLKVGGKSTALETAQFGDGARVNGDLEVTGTMNGSVAISPIIASLITEDVVIEALTLNDNLIIDFDVADVSLGVIGIKLDYDITDTSAGTFKGISVDIDKIGSSTSNNDIYGVWVDIDNTTATNGTNAMYGIYATPKLTHAADAGTPTVIGGYFKADGSFNGTSTAYGIMIDKANGNVSDTDAGLIIRSIDTADYFTIDVGGSGATALSTIDDGGEAGHLTLDADGDIYLDAHTGVFRFYDAGDTDDSFKLTVEGGTGATTLQTVSAGADGHLTLDADGDINLNAIADVNIPADIGLTFGDAGEKIEGDGTDLTLTTGRDLILTAGRALELDITGEVNFNTTTAGFTPQTGTDAVSIDWGEGNKYNLLLNNSSTVTFGTNPMTACNLLLKVKQGNGGSNLITWAVTSGTIYWAGGGVLNTDEPTLTTTDDKTDILTFYFDGTNYFGVASLDFDTT